MDTYRTDDEQAEVIKKWWLENGRAVVTGLVIGIAVVVGVRYWFQQQKDMSHKASELYAKIESGLASSDPGSVLSTGQLLLKDYSNTTYAAMAGLAMAKEEVAADKNDLAKDHLKWVVEHADGGLQHAARLRLARLLLNDGKLKEADTLLGGVKSAGYASAYDELRADIALAKGEKTQARELYRLALNEGRSGLSGEFLKMKIDNIAADNQVTAVK